MILTLIAVGFTSNDQHPSSISRLLPPALPGPPTPASGVQWRCFGPLAVKHYPTDGQAIPPLLRTSCYSLPSVGPPRTRTSQVSHSSSSATPLPHLPHLLVVPVWGLTVIHCLGALGGAWSTWSTNESHRKRTVRGEADSGDALGPWTHACNRLLITRK